LSVSDRDNGLKALLQRVKASKLQITVGVHAEEGAGTYEGGATVADVASYNEFGTERIPARPFLSGWFDANQSAIEKQLQKAGERITKGQDPEQALDLVAQWAAGQVQKGISAGVPPPNAASTVARKGSSKPLIGETGQLRSSIRGRVGHA
jgi:hypothetical protein